MKDKSSLHVERLGVEKHGDIEGLDMEDPSFDLDLLHFTVEGFPDSCFAHFSLAKLYGDRGDIERAIEHCKKCLGPKPNDGDAASLLGRLEQQR